MKDYEWVDFFVDGKIGVVGIFEYVVEQLGDVVYVEFFESGDWID